MTIAEKKIALWNEGKEDLGKVLNFALTYDYESIAHGFSHDRLEEWIHYTDESILIIRWPCVGRGRWAHPEKIKMEVCYEEE